MSVSKLHSHTPLGTASEPSRELLNAFGENVQGKGWRTSLELTLSTTGSEKPFHSSSRA